MGYGGKGKSSYGKGKSGKGYFGVRRTIKGKGFGKGKGKRKGKGKGSRRSGKGKGKGKVSADSLDRMLEDYMGPDEIKKVLDTELDTYFGKTVQKASEGSASDKEKPAEAPAETGNGKTSA